MKQNARAKPLIANPVPAHPVPAPGQRVPVAKTRPGLEGLDAYRVSLAFYELLVKALGNRARCRITRQLLDAAGSTILNIGEAYPALGADRARRFRIAAQEASEAGVALNLLAIRGVLRGTVLTSLSDLADRQRAMLWRLSRPR